MQTVLAIKSALPASPTTDLSRTSGLQFERVENGSRSLTTTWWKGTSGTILYVTVLTCWTIRSTCILAVAVDKSPFHSETFPLAPS